MGLMVGVPAPSFATPSSAVPSFSSENLGGRYMLMAFLPGPGPERDAAIELVLKQRAHFMPAKRLFLGVLPDEASFRQAPEIPPFHWLGDWSGDLRRTFDAAGPDGEVAPQWVVIDPSNRIMSTAPLSEGPAILANLLGQGDPDDHAGVPMSAPVLIVPRVFEPDLCRRLIDLYEAEGGKPSGVMRERDGKTVEVFIDYKRRKDVQLLDPALRAALDQMISRRLAPEIQKAFCFAATRIERHIVACYDAEDGGYFRPHRDNTTAGTAHRRFAVSINLNGEFEGGDLRFPEFGQKTYRPPVGGAVVFSCSLLHEATPVTRGTRYAFLPFLYDEAAAEIRAANRHLLVDGPSASRAASPGP